MLERYSGLQNIQSMYNKSLYYLFQGFQGVHIYFGDIISLCDSIIILPNRVNVHQAVVCHLNTFEIREEPVKKKGEMLMIQTHKHYAMHAKGFSYVNYNKCSVWKMK